MFLATRCFWPRWALAVLIVVATVSSAYAQTVDPTHVEFNPSPDHSVTLASGEAVLTSYRLDLFVSGISTVYESVDLGKPAPQADGKIRVAFISLLPAPLQPGVVYEARVAAVGPGGESSSAVSNTFMIAGGCTATLTPNSQSFSAAGATGSTSVSVNVGCAWTATSNASWITITSGAFGTGGGSVSFSVAANTSPSVRTGTLTVAGVAFTITQAAAPCTFNVSPSAVSLSAPSGSFALGVTTVTGCAWTASSSAAWLTVMSGTTGNASGTVTLSYTANTGAATRSATATVGGVPVTVTQASGTCSSVAPTSQSVAAAATTGSATVTASSGCAWTATSNASWITVTSGSSGSGNGTVNFSIAANTVSASRSGTLTIAGTTYTVIQAGAPCSYTLSPLSQAMASAGGSGTATVTTPGGCTWTANANAPWITVTSAVPAVDSGNVTYTVTANPTTAIRTGTLTIAGKTLAVTQAAATCTYTASPLSETIGAGGGIGTVTVAAGSTCNWTASSSAAWIAITSGGTGSGSDTVGYSVAANTSTVQRTANLTIAGNIVTITQAAALCDFGVSPLTQSVGSAGASGTLTVTTGTSCGWTTSSAAAWITITSGVTGSGSSSVSFTVAANTTTVQRSAILVVADSIVTITQLGAAVGCAYSISPSTQAIPSNGGAGSAAVTTGIGCQWTAYSSAPWITVTSGTSSAGAGTVNYTVAANPSTMSRTGTLTIAGRTLTVTQAAATACTFAVSPTSLAVSALGGTQTITVTTGAGCGWSILSTGAWLTYSGSVARTGPGTVSVTVALNSSTTARSASLTVAGKVIPVTQSAMTQPSAPKNLRIAGGG